MNARKLDEMHLIAENSLDNILDKFKQIWLQGREWMMEGPPLPPEEEEDEEEPIAGLA